METTDRCNEIAFPGGNQLVCVAPKGHAEGKHNFWPQELSGRAPQPIPPEHAFEMTIRIGANDWEYVLRTMDELADHIRKHGEHCSLSSGSWSGCHSVDIRKRDISPDDYRKELEAWRQSL